jgi:hypothetical protein
LKVVENGYKGVEFKGSTPAAVENPAGGYSNVPNNRQ